MKFTLNKAFVYSSRINQTFLMPARDISILLALSMVVGFLAGGAGTLFHICVDRLLQLRVALLEQYFSQYAWGWVAVSFCTALLLLLSVWIVRRFAPEAGGSGVQEIEGALQGSLCLNWRRLIPVKFISGILTLGTGMVMGREGPTIHIGGTIGQMVSDLFKTHEDNQNTLVTAGAAAGLSAAFNAPLSAILFAIEEMRAQFKYGTYSVQAVAMSVFIAAVVVRMYSGQVPAINMSHFAAPPLETLPLFFFLGIIFGVFGILFNRALLFSLEIFSCSNRFLNTLLILLTGALIGYLGWSWPQTVGSGDETLLWAVRHSNEINVLIVLFVVRIFTTLMSYGTGAPGGIFAPMLALGTLLGLWYGHYINDLISGLELKPGWFAIAGMGALFASTVRAPLTGIALSLELTHNYTLILPLILTVGTATVTAELLGGKPIYSLLLQRSLARENKRPDSDCD